MYQVRVQNLSAPMQSGAIGTTGTTFGKHMTANSLGFYSAYACPAKPGGTQTDHPIK
jgi:hypothetical protein